MENIITYKSPGLLYLDTSKALLCGIDHIDYKTAIQLIEKGYKIVIEGKQGNNLDSYNINIPFSPQGEVLLKYKDSIIGIKGLYGEILIISCSIIFDIMYISIYNDKTFSYGISNIFESDYSGYRCKLRQLHKPMTNKEVGKVIKDRLVSVLVDDKYNDTYTFKGGIHNIVITTESISEFRRYFFY